ncbi:MAG: ribonuclease III [Anaerolineae bacterium]|nr:ribonuclease III [Anaerolineae bacterium]MDW8102640.1 ribonuclease III [Anaerolineae bacterium]
MKELPSINFAELEEKLGINFTDKALLLQALVHTSYVNENPSFPLNDNERLEFLGDAVLDFVVGDYLYHRFPEMREGELTWLRASLVKGETLAQFARKISLGRYLLLGRGEEESGGRERSSILGSAFEALIGAIYLDKDLDAVKTFLEPFIEPELDQLFLETIGMDPKSRLQEFIQEWLGVTPSYRTLEERGPEHARTFVVGVFLGEKLWGKGEGSSKQQASVEAARIALETLQKISEKDLSWKLPRRIRLSLLQLLPFLEKLHRWALAGSVALALYGLPLTPHDIDLVTDRRGARALSSNLGEFTLSPLRWKENEHFASLLAQFKVEGVRVEVIGDLKVKGEKSLISFNLWPHVRVLPFVWGKVNVVPLEWQLVVNIVAGKGEKAEMIARHLRSEGYDEALLGKILRSRAVTRAVREEVRSLLSKDRIYAPQEP